MTDTTTATGYVYLIAAPEGLFKIGRSVNPARRLREVLCGSSGDQLLTAIPSAEPGWLERYLHRAFSHRRVRREWFRLSEDEVGLILAIPAAARPEDIPPAVRSLHDAAPDGRTETVRLAVEIVRKINVIAAVKGKSVPDYLAERFGPLIDEDYKAAADQVSKEAKTKK